MIHNFYIQISVFCRPNNINSVVYILYCPRKPLLECETSQLETTIFIFTSLISKTIK